MKTNKELPVFPLKEQPDRHPIQKEQFNRLNAAIDLLKEEKTISESLQELLLSDRLTPMSRYFFFFAKDHELLEISVTGNAVFGMIHKEVMQLAKALQDDQALLEECQKVFGSRFQFFSPQSATDVSEQSDQVESPLQVMLGRMQRRMKSLPPVLNE